MNSDPYSHFTSSCNERETGCTPLDLSDLSSARPAWGFYVRASSQLGHPCQLPDITTTPHGDLRRQDFHLLA